MRVVYESVLTQIRNARAKALYADKRIEYIEVSRAEWEELCRDLYSAYCPAPPADLCSPMQVMGITVKRV